MRRLILSLICATQIFAQTEYKILSIDAFIQGKTKFADVFFSQHLDPGHAEDLSLASVLAKTLPSGTALVVTGVRRMGGDPTELEIALSGNVPAADVQLMVEIKRPLHFVVGASTQADPGPFTFTATLIKDAKTLGDAMQKLAAAMTATAQPSTEKSVFASGFVTSATGGQTQGGGDVHLNSPDLGVAGLKTFADLQTSTATGSNADTFEAGASYRVTHLFGQSGRARIQAALAAFNNASSDAERGAAAVVYDDAMTSFQHRTLAASFFDLALKVEGDPLTFGVTNAVYDSAFKLQSRVKSLNGSGQGFFYFQLLPAGIEAGRTVHQPNGGGASVKTQFDGIERVKAGATLNAGWNSATGPLKRVEFEVAAVDRYLFLNEISYDAVAKTNRAIASGNKPYGQADVKLFLYETKTTRYGVRISYQRGSLPPVYAPVKSFQVGFLVESIH